MVESWLAVLVCVVVGQILLTLWFTVFFGEPWARAYGAKDRAEHTKEIPPYTYAFGLFATLALTLGLAVLQQRLGVESLAGGLELGLLVAVCFCVATGLPGYAFLKKWDAFAIAISSQVVLILVISSILALWGG
ncbi:MAG: DUF1761 family protein [Pseudomonadales bacterium]|nr:DUF1761 family protein [Pseudomonadales bacterium]